MLSPSTPQSIQNQQTRLDTLERKAAEDVDFFTFIDVMNWRRGKTVYPTQPKAPKVSVDGRTNFVLASQP